jgi:hypothetical protein
MACTPMLADWKKKTYNGAASQCVDTLTHGVSQNPIRLTSEAVTSLHGISSKSQKLKEAIQQYFFVCW